MTRLLRIEVGFDFICPWCLIGLRQLQRALAALRQEQPAVAVHVHWRGVQLLPDAPAAGWPFLEFYRHRLGSDTAVRARQAMVQRAAEAAGTHINYSAIAVMPNTADAHRVLAYATRNGNAAQRDALLERLLRAYFEDGEDLGNADVLLAHGAAAGFDRAVLQSALQGAGVPYLSFGAASNGVPCFTIGGTLQLAGAQPHDVLLAAMRDALSHDPASV